MFGRRSTENSWSPQEAEAFLARFEELLDQAADVSSDLHQGVDKMKAVNRELNVTLDKIITAKRK